MQITRGATVPRNVPSRVDFCRYFPLSAKVPEFREDSKKSRRSVRLDPICSKFRRDQFRRSSSIASDFTFQLSHRGSATRIYIYIYIYIYVRKPKILHPLPDRIPSPLKFQHFPLPGFVATTGQTSKAPAVASPRISPKDPATVFEKGESARARERERERTRTRGAICFHFCFPATRGVAGSRGSDSRPAVSGGYARIDESACAVARVCAHGIRTVRSHAKYKRSQL